MDKDRWRLRSLILTDSGMSKIKKAVGPRSPKEIAPLTKRPVQGSEEKAPLCPRAIYKAFNREGSDYDTLYYLFRGLDLQLDDGDYMCSKSVRNEQSDTQERKLRVKSVSASYPVQEIYSEDVALQLVSGLDAGDRALNQNNRTDVSCRETAFSISPQTNNLETKRPADERRLIVERLQQLSFNQLIKVIDLVNAPLNEIASELASPALRVSNLLAWAECPNGCGLKGLDDAITRVLRHP